MIRIRNLVNKKINLEGVIAEIRIMSFKLPRFVDVFERGKYGNSGIKIRIRKKKLNEKINHRNKENEF